MATEIAQLYRNSIYWKAAAFDIKTSARNIARRASSRIPVVRKLQFPRTPVHWEAIGILITAYFGCDDKGRASDSDVQSFLFALHQSSGLPLLKLSDNLEVITEQLASAYVFSTQTELGGAWSVEQAAATISERKGISLTRYLLETQMASTSPVSAEDVGSIEDISTEEKPVRERVIQHEDGTFGLDCKTRPPRSTPSRSQSDMCAEVSAAGLAFQCPYPRCMVALKQLTPHIRSMHRKEDDFSLEHVETEQRFYIISSLKSEDIIWRLVTRG